MISVRMGCHVVQVLEHCVYPHNYGVTIASYIVYRIQWSQSCVPVLTTRCSNRRGASINLTTKPHEAGNPTPPIDWVMAESKGHLSSNDMLEDFRL